MKLLVRTLASLFILVLIAIALLGWVWNGQHQPAAAMAWGRAALGGCIVAGVIGLVAIWTPRRAEL